MLVLIVDSGFQPGNIRADFRLGFNYSIVCLSQNRCSHFPNTTKESSSFADYYLSIKDHPYTISFIIDAGLKLKLINFVIICSVLLVYL